MTTIYLETPIQAPRRTCFDFARSIDLHAASMSHTNERVVEGRTSGLIQLGEFVTWEATHFMVRQRLSSRIIELVEPEYFIDEMISGAFKSLWHKHSFVQRGNETLMIDDFKYEVPYGFLGSTFNFLALKNYLRKLLLDRNAIIKKASEANS
ncbi:MAG TPA: SRPBCC family protein [Cyclobacteriaceae bacterium]|nr:SRPBCC family protein [Cyclobacteriaceae bacterium]